MNHKVTRGVFRRRLPDRSVSML